MSSPSNQWAFFSPQQIKHPTMGIRINLMMLSNNGVIQKNRGISPMFNRDNVAPNSNNPQGTEALPKYVAKSIMNDNGG
ncbi:hypothetical protein WICPIJ_000222 [Wickerhamomyces pijperi]|uniref:Uncharacterized protein n=1 Tax=Wickerhamomyces pijperi TaxID=599730 RepID=A0A9P8QD72_WICPI|nr:hypothetical protein WICPIJ_000222 [Wickerhamomyces pijperi]